MRYFISGHGWLSQEQFDAYYVPVLDRILYGDPETGAYGDLDPYFVIGDFHGVDLMAQKYIAEAGLANCITVYHMFDKPRNLAYDSIKTIGGFKTDEERDAAMTAASDFDVAFVFREGSCTEKNIKRRYLANGIVQEREKAD